MLRWLHVVDLDAARTGRPVNRALVLAIASAVPVPVEVGGGVRTEADVDELLDGGAARVVLGTVAVDQPDQVRRMVRRHPGRVALGIDYRQGSDGRTEVAARGWEQPSGRTVAEVMAEYADVDLAALVVTAIARDGTLDGPDLDGLATVLAATELPVIASGGVGGVADVEALARLAIPVGAVVLCRPESPAAGRCDHRPGPGGRQDDRRGGIGGVRTVRVIPCLDVDGGRVVKGVRFTDLFDAGDPVELARRYDDQGADELVFLDITASSDNRRTMVEVVSRTAEAVFIPFTVGGGVRSVEDARLLLRAGADKVGINTAAVDRPELVAELAVEFGSQCVVVAVDARRRVGGLPMDGDSAGSGWEVFTHGGRSPTGIDAVDWCGRSADTGAGEILLTSMDRDGTRHGFDLALTRAVTDRCNVPVIASGGVGTLDHLVEGAREGRAEGVLAASIFHLGQFTVAEAKERLADAGVPVRPVATSKEPGGRPARPPSDRTGSDQSDSRLR